MHPNDIDPKDEPCFWPPREAAADQALDSLAASAPREKTGDIARHEKPQSEGLEEEERDAQTAWARNGNGRHLASASNGVSPDAMASEAQGMRKAPPRRSVAHVGDDWMGEDDWMSEDGRDRGTVASEDAKAQAPQEAIEPEQATPAAVPAKNKRAYGRSRLPAAAPKLLPLSHEPDMFPVFMSRSDLFSAIRANSGGTYNGPLQASGKVSLTFQGPRLSMADKRVWEAMVRVAKRGRFDLAQPFVVPMGDVAAMAGFERGQTRSVWSAIERLAASSIDGVVDGASVSGRLLASATKDGQRRLVAFDSMFMEAALGRALNAAMTGSARGRSEPPLAQWLGDYFLTHEPFAEAPDLDYLRRLCGHLGSPKGFVAALEASMASLEAARQDLVASWSIDKSTRASGAWRLFVERGNARPRVKHPGKAKAAGAQTDVRALAAKARRGGPAL